MKLVFLEDFGKAIIPLKVRPRIRARFLNAGVKDVPYRLFGGLFYAFILLTIIIFFAYINPLLSQSFSGVPLFLLSFLMGILTASILAGISFYTVSIYLDLKIYKRTEEIEEVLQEFLKFVSENLKGGMSFDKALWSAIRPEFGVLGSEMRLVAKRVMTGEDFESAITDFTDKYDSPMLKRSFSLIIEGVKGGGEIAEIIDKVVEDIGETRLLKKEMSAANVSYTIFITFVAIGITPGLFALSYQLLNIIESFISRIFTEQGGPVATGINLPIMMSNLPIRPQQFRAFSMYALTIIAAFSSMIVSIIRKGSIKSGWVYIPLYIGMSLIVYLVFMAILGALFSSLILL